MANDNLRIQSAATRQFRAIPTKPRHRHTTWTANLLDALKQMSQTNARLQTRLSSCVCKDRLKEPSRQYQIAPRGRRFGRHHGESLSALHLNGASPLRSTWLPGKCSQGLRSARLAPLSLLAASRDPPEPPTQLQQRTRTVSLDACGGAEASVQEHPPTCFLQPNH